MPQWLRLTLLCLVGVTACGVGALFSGDGGSCHTDGNCPSGHLCCDGTCRTRCDGGSDGTGPNINSSIVTVQLLSDYTPRHAFDEVLVQLDQRPAVLMPVGVAAHFDMPRQVASFIAVPRGDHRATVTLLLRGAQVDVGTASASVVADTTIVVTVARIRAPCSADQDCLPTTPVCAAAHCISGMCLERPVPDACVMGERCFIGAGCVSADGECGEDADCDDQIACTRDLCTAGLCSNLADDAACDHALCAPFEAAANNVTGCLPPPCSADNCISAPCVSAACVEDQCVKTPLCLADERCCDGVCGVDCGDPRPCAGRATGAICRPSAGACDVAETCDGLADVCPPDVRLTMGTVCRAIAGPCDLLDICDGVSAACPPDAVADPDTECRAASNGCDAPEVCNGVSALCSVDVLHPAGFTCRAATGMCDLAERCDGLDAACPPDMVSTGNVCRSAAGPCDVAEVCTGGKECPADGFASTAVVCRSARGPCDRADTCSGSSVACPADQHQPASSMCRAPTAGPCDDGAFCDGSSDACPPNRFTSTSVVCRPANGVCDVAERCTGQSFACPADGYASASTVCRGADASGCDLAESCTGASPTCPPDQRIPDGADCGMLDPYTYLVCCAGACECTR